MSSHDENEEIISSPLSSPRSSIFDLDDFDFASPPPERAPGPALIDHLPPFRPELEPAMKSAPSSKASSRKSPPNANKTKQGPVENPDEEPVAESISAHVHEDGCAHKSNQDASTADNAQAGPPAAPTTPESPDPLTAEPANNGKKRKAPATSSTTKKKITLKKARKDDPKKWQVPSVFTDVKSPLVTAPIRAILLHPQAWDVLSPGDQADLRAMLSHDRPASLSSSPSPPGSGPQTQHSPPPAPRPNLDYLRSDDSFRFDCARYSENIEEGRHDPEWLADSWIAHERRKRGDFREYLAAKLERDWDVQLPESEASDDSGGDEEEKEEEAKPAGEGGAADESPVSSSVGENQLTELKLGVVPGDGKQPVPEADEATPEGGEIVVG